jgi:hypothetical protein
VDTFGFEHLELRFFSLAMRGELPQSIHMAAGAPDA